MNISNTSSSSSNSSTSYSRITGLATGMDTDGMVKQALTPYQSKIDSAKQDLQYTQWQQEAYVGFITDLKDFSNYFDITKPDNMMLSASYTGTTASSSLSNGVDASNYLTATTLPGAVKGTYQVNIANIAESAKKQSFLNGISFSTSDVSSLSDGVMTFSLNGVDQDIKLSSFSSSDTVSSVVDDINAQISKTSLKDIVTATNNNGKIVISSSSSDKITLKSSSISELSGYSNTIISMGYDSSTKLSDLGIKGSFDIELASGKTTINIDSNKSIGDFVNDIGNTMIGTDPLSKYIDVSFSNLTKKLTISTKDTGANTKLNITGSGFSDTVGLNSSNIGSDASLQIKAPGENSFVTVTKSTNNFSIDGVIYNLVSAKPGDTINLNVKSDASSQLDKFKKFIDKYNALIDKINTKINEKKNYDYKPLTDAQKSSMKDTEITAWESKAKEGILRRDSYLTGVVSQLRQAVYDTVNKAGINITDIGITTTSNYLDGGKLVIDETKLKSALENKGDLVQKLFTNPSDKNEESGIFQRFKNILNNAVGTDGSLIKKAGYSNSRWVSENDLSKSISDKNTMIKNLQNMMTQKQQSLYSMYATLEQNMNNLNSQSSWLASSLGAQ